MGIFSDAVALVGSAIGILAGHTQEFSAALGIALVIAALCWVAASNYSRLWNLRFQATQTHHRLCLIAALSTLFFALIFASLKYAKEAAERSVDAWSVQLMQDSDWESVTFQRAYEEVKKLGREDPQQLQQQWEQERTILVSHADSQRKDAEVWATASAEKFQDDHPFLSKIIWARTDIPATRLAQKMEEYFKTQGNRFPVQQSINIAVTEIKSDLQTQTDRIIPVARVILVIFFLLVQIIPFSLIGYAAYKDLKVTT